MHLSAALAVAAAVAPIVTAHDGPSLPRIAGMNIKDLKTRNLLSNFKARAAALEAEHVNHAEKREPLVPRQNIDGQCGRGFGSCAPGICCSQAGWCGTTSDYCYSPGCQYAYGPGCPENQTPAGTNTSSVARPLNGNVLYGGAGIYDCVTPGTVALTFDDGPLQNYTAHVLDILAKYNAHATFFITGNNLAKGEIDTTPELTAVIQRAHTEGHQIASHTWTHLDLSAISATDRRNQMYKNEMALRNILGFFPAYMRPPYSSCTSGSGCEKDLKTLGYHVIYFDVDTDDYEQDSPTQIQNSKNWFKGNITAAGATSADSSWLSISHDIHFETAYNLTDYMLSTLTSLGYTAVTVGDCLGDPSQNWYRAAGGAGTPTSSVSPPTSSAPASSGVSTPPASSGVSTPPASSSVSTAPAPSSTLKVSLDATCGGTTGQTCKGSSFGNCCSGAGWCGSTSAYCGTGCQSAFGTCGTSSSPSSSSAPAPSGTLKVSQDATCGGTTGQTCQGSAFGNCCSGAGWCGTTTAYCGTGCQTGFGTCT